MKKTRSPLGRIQITLLHLYLVRDLCREIRRKFVDVGKELEFVKKVALRLSACGQGEITQKLYEFDFRINLSSFICMIPYTN